LTIGTFMSVRTLHFNYAPASVINDPAAVGSLEDNALVNIRNITAMPLGTKITKARSIPQSATSAGWDRPLRPVARYGASRFVLRQRSSSE
jgi:hypothetical protein